MINIFKFSWPILLSWTVAYAIFEPISYVVIPAVSKAQSVQDYYNPRKIPIPVVFFGDYIYSTFLFVVAQIFITATLGAPITLLDWIIRFAAFVAVQWTGDFSFYMLINWIPQKTAYLQFFRRYTEEVSVGAPIGDTIYGLCWFALTQFVATYLTVPTQVAILSLFLFGTLVVSY
jgi:hypothetical protein